MAATHPDAPASGTGNPPNSPAVFTGRDRVRTTRTSVKLINEFMKYLICTGGISVVLVFAGIMAFICWVVLPLFDGARLNAQPGISLQTPTGAPIPPLAPNSPPARVLALGLDEDLTSLWKMTDDGQLATFCLSNGRQVHREQVLDQPVVASVQNAEHLALVGADGAVRYGQIKTESEYLNLADLPADAQLPAVGEVVPWSDGVAEMTQSKQLRVVRLRAEFSDPTPVGDGPPVAICSLDYEYETEREHIAALREDGRMFLEVITRRTNMMTGKIRRIVKHHELPAIDLGPAKSAPWLMLGLNARMLYLIDVDGRCRRYNLENADAPFLAEEIDLTPEPGVAVTAIRWLNGRLTLIVADSTGGVSGWFAAPLPEGAVGGADRYRLIQAHVLENQGATPTALASSIRDRQFVTLDSRGGLLIRHMTSNSTQGRLHLPLAAETAIVAMAPGNNAIAVLAGQDNLHFIRMDNPHADGSVSAMFSKLWYEGYPAPAYVYQSSAGTDDAEPKFSMIPLIFGTLKATLYAMLFSIPIAVLAAIYTSEFMPSRTRNTIKPVVEMMASLPSVVLGFIAAQVLAPIVGGNLVGVMLAVGLIPAGLFTVGYIWQLLPGTAMRRVVAWQRFALMFMIVLVMLWLSWNIAPPLENFLFEGDVKTWLAGSAGSALPGWLFLLTPLCFIALTLIYSLYIKPNLKIYRSRTSELQFGSFELARGSGLILGSLGLALLFSQLLATAGFDLRGILTSSYVERNSLVLGMIMGFAIIPIIYTVSEDALSAVPNTLRSASLGMGATPWQTAIRVVLPVAFPGVFSACMIGLGRAAGETMIVLMASGRTPILDVSPFNGLSALSANIATELPEAPKNSTHYRMLFMSAVILFILTFVVNTAAEIVRLRYRKRSANL